MVPSERKIAGKKLVYFDCCCCSFLCLFFYFILFIIISNGNRTEWSPIRSVIIRVICLITSMIADRIGRHEVLLPINHNFNKICDIIGYFLNQKTRNLRFGFASSEKKSHLSAHVMARTVLSNCPIKAEIRAVDNQSDVRILL